MRVSTSTPVESACSGLMYPGVPTIAPARGRARDTWTTKYLMTGTIKAIEGGRIEDAAYGSRGNASA